MILDDPMSKNKVLLPDKIIRMQHSNKIKVEINKKTKEREKKRRPSSYIGGGILVHVNFSCIFSECMFLMDLSALTC